MIPIDLSGRAALVTGGTGELGRVICRSLAEAGATVAFTYLRAAERAAALERELATQSRASSHQADVTNADDVARLGREVEVALGWPDILVSTAVTQYQHTTLLNQPLEDFESQYKSCVLHNVLLAKVFIPPMIQRGWGRFIALNTECSMQCWPTQSAYVAGKRGLDGALRVLAREVGEHGVTVNQVAPGWMVSESRPDSFDDFTNAYRDQVALRRRGREQDVAHAVAFLASDLAEFITGLYLPVCGGSVMPTI